MARPPPPLPHSAALSALLGGDGAAASGLPPAMIAALAEAGVHVRVARARRARATLAAGASSSSSESGSGSDDDEDVGQGSATVLLEEEEEETLDMDVPPSSLGGPAGAAKRKRPAARPEVAAEAIVDEDGGDDAGTSSSGESEGASAAAAAARRAAASTAPTTEYAPDAPGRYIGPSAGCTAVAAAVRGGRLVVANAGDSRAVLCRAGGAALPLTSDHKPTDGPELARIVAAGGFVAEGRVNGSLNLSRAFGDAEHKQSPGVGPEGQAVTASPDVSAVDLAPGDRFLLLACDGIWDICTCQEAVDLVAGWLDAGSSPADAACRLCDHCLAPDTGGCGKGCDNMSALVVLLKKWAPLT